MMAELSQREVVTIQIGHPVLQYKPLIKEAFVPEETCPKAGFVS